jgi:predicted secreted protein
MKRLALFLMTAFVLSCEKDIETERISLFLKVNDTFDIKLVTRPAEGFVWSFENEQSMRCLKVVDKSSYPVRPGLIGGPDSLIYKLVAIKPGNEILKFEEFRPWEKWNSLDQRTWYSVHIAK